jgi:hypothetical protein
MKKLFVMMLSVAVVLSLVLPFSVSAATPMSASAKAGDAVVDGVISADEYGDPFVLNGESSVTWAGLGAITSPITYRFAWSEKGLYIALSYAESTADGSQLQINCNPGGQLTADQEGLFITIQPGGVVWLHNHNTPLGEIEAPATYVDITSKVTMQSKASDGVKVTEVLIPMDAFRITDSSFTFSAGEMACSAFAVLFDAAGAPKEVGAAVSSDLSVWKVGKLGLGTLTLAAAEEETPTEQPTEAPKDPDTNPGTGDSAWIVPSIYIAVLAVVLFGVIYHKTSAKV